MSERMTDDWALYEIASDWTSWERLLHVNFSVTEMEYLQEYYEVYKEYLDLHSQLLDLEKQLPPHPQVNELTKIYKELRSECDIIENEIERLVHTDIMQNILKYRFERRTRNETEEPQVAQKDEKEKVTIKDWFFGIFGVFGIILFTGIRIIISILPFVMIGGNFFLNLLLIGINYFIPLTSIIFWIWGLVCAIRGVQDIFAIIYYILFAIAWLPFFINTITSLFKKD